ncbi:MAG: P1 family peptidase [Thermomicrobiales bacterium]|nr:P1 family peptidase [Thermomicrobiales bacterium]
MVAIIDVDGVSIGHTTLAPAKTGCTCIVFDRPALTAAEVRGQHRERENSICCNPDALCSAPMRSC